MARIFQPLLTHYLDSDLLQQPGAAYPEINESGSPFISVCKPACTFILFLDPNSLPVFAL